MGGWLPMLQRNYAARHLVQLIYRVRRQYFVHMAKNCVCVLHFWARVGTIFLYSNIENDNFLDVALF
jgi:hypothetical protein